MSDYSSKPLCAVQALLLKELARHVGKKCPSNTELAKTLSLNSGAHIHASLKALEAKGKIRYLTRGRQRIIELSETGEIVGVPKEKKVRVSRDARGPHQKDLLLEHPKSIADGIMPTDQQIADRFDWEHYGKAHDILRRLVASGEIQIISTAGLHGRKVRIVSTGVELLSETLVYGHPRKRKNRNR